MGILYAVRHGQAAFYSDDYDRLTELGQQQSRQLGAYWVAQGMTFDRVFVGPRKRHLQTLAAVRDAYHAEKLPFPEAETLPELDEFPFEVLIKEGMTALQKVAPELSALAAGFASGTDQRPGTFQTLFAKVTTLWLEGRLPLSEEVESWQSFRARVSDGARQMTAGAARGQRVAAFTSAGTVAGLTGYALDLADEKTLSFSWVVKNSAISEFLFSGTRFSLSVFNATPQLTPEQVTHR